jgi:AraC family transcriptional regulator
MSEVSIKFLMNVKIASTEKKTPREEITKAVEQLSQSLKEKKIKLAGCALGLLHEDLKTVDLQKTHYEVCLPISGKLKEERELKGKELEKGAFACITHSGPAETLPDSYRILLKWIEDNGYRVSGSTREVYQKGIGEPGGSPQECLIEIQCPIKK